MAKKLANSKTRSPVDGQPITLPVMEIQQGNYVMYAFVAQSELLRKIATVSRRAEDTDKGYQRHLKESRLKQIARYIDDKHGVIPNNIILDFFEKQVKVDRERKTITLPTNKVCAWVIDGQHRLFGFEHSKRQYPLLVIGFLQLNQEEKVNIFVTINTEQKRLPTSLCLDLLNIIGSDEDINTRCRELVAKLNEEDESPWYDLVDMTGEGVGYISLVNFVRKVKPLISSTGVLNTLPTMFKSAPQGGANKRGRTDSIHDANLLYSNLDAFHQGTDDLSPFMPACGGQAGLHPLPEVLEAL